MEGPCNLEVVGCRIIGAGTGWAAAHGSMCAARCELISRLQLGVACVQCRVVVHHNRGLTQAALITSTLWAQDLTSS